MQTQLTLDLSDHSIVWLSDLINSQQPELSQADIREMQMDDQRREGEYERESYRDEQ